jgi:hypothetical protein
LKNIYIGGKQVNNTSQAGGIGQNIQKTGGIICKK